MKLSMLLAQVDISQEFAPAAKFGSLASLVNLISRAVAIGGGFLLIVAFVYTGYLYLTAAGDTKNIEKTKIVLTYSVIGMIVIAVSYWLTQIIAGLLGQDF
ncbi:hypothetical protein A2313_03385 [Candidatus Roizmanbacteria bacterium RIFOXYB2_FULL_41_10]|nr:MAG: hypothetical protein A2262_01920 [Candidatus Roizmanbacteria bacterium RIFOXYA2_FULL_41_8]OGK71668.1 MAG: hypothetical protein A2403_04375 [Candidatus Roizmanbacteria bacterium RIFOXYC1_FULL_41_16]OGK72127.1 MAG: hypothetical protein A2313_03385 [Candidatus Roizmanbacteria bacterium RIFOXYB2_FULL_41_10]OGK75038.1 MAG: hypothetical protein A2575_03900 [Candidatus Roizmanbacteria bacterium RIFOXYD1_FULL_41_24]OGK75227.1 MAG: hypothetical protein A2459_03370 [Candidatus Roizmanbacteria bac